MKKFSKLLSILLCLSMVLSFLPTIASAADVTASKTVADLITEYGWTSTTTKQEFKLDDVVTVKIDGGSNSGKAYDGDNIRIYATDSPAGSITISVPDGYELVSVKITTKTGTYAYLCVGDDTTTDISNVSTAVSGTSVVLNSVKNGSNGKQVRVTAFEVVYSSGGSGEHTHSYVMTNLGDGTHAMKCSCGETQGTASAHTGYESDYICDDCSAVVAPAADSTLTLPQASTLGSALAGATSSDKYYVSGTIVSVANATYGNMTIEDENGNTLYIYGTYDADGTNRYDAMATQPVAGDTVTLYGKIGSYNGNPQMQNAWITEHTPVVNECTHSGYESDYICDDCSAVVAPAADSTLTLPQASALGTALAGGTSSDKYYVSGTIVSVANTTYGNMTIEDENGNTFYIYGTYDADGTNRYDAMATQPVAGDSVTLYGKIGSYNGNPQMLNAWITEHTPVVNECTHSGYESDYICDDCSAVIAPAADSTLTLPQASALGTALAGDTSSDKYYVSGTIVSVANATYGNMTIEDENGNTLYIYGTYDADGTNRYDAMATQPVAGDSVTLYGKIGSYNGNPQMQNAWITEHTPVVNECTHSGYESDYICDDCSAVVAPAADSTLTLPQASALGTALAGGTSSDKYYISGTIVSVANTTYGNMTIEDENGNTFYIYGTYDADGTNRYDAMATQPVAGDSVTLYGKIGSYNGNPQMLNAWITVHEAHEHDYQGADCVTKGICSICGAEGEIAADKHSFTDYVSDGNATCTEDGTKTATCDHEGCSETHTITDEGSAKDHSFTDYVSDGNATCTVDGTKTATCNREGCTATDTVTDEDSALDHSFKNYVPNNDATCTVDGTKTATCDNAGCSETHTITDEGSAKGHTLDDGVITKEATCTKTGTMTHKCTVDGCNFEQDVEIAIDETAHEWINGQVTTQPTCSTKGVRTYTCRHNSEHTKTEDVDIKPDNHVNDADDDGICDDCDKEYCKHEFDTVVAEPTCEEHGYTTYNCKHCTYEYEDKYVDPVGHDWDDGVQTKAPTCTTKGIMTHTCSVCEETKTEEIAMVDHTWTAATCTSPKVCSVCGEKSGDAAGHTWTDATCTAPKTCSVCKATEGKALGHTWTDATCKAPATCSVCNETKGDKAEHSYDDGVVTTEPTTEKEGVKTYTCSVCGDKYTESIDKLPAEDTEDETTTPSEPEATEPEATEPEATEPEATEPEATEPEEDDTTKIPGTLAEQIEEANGLANKEHLSYESTITGVITDNPYASSYTEGAYKFTVSDGTNTLLCYYVPVTGGTPEKGDTVTVTGCLTAYNGAAQFDDSAVATIVKKGETTDEPVVEDPAADSELTVEEAIALGSSKDHNTYTENKYYVTGVIVEVYNTTYGNMKIADEDGNILTIYGTFDADGTNRYDAMATQPVAGDTVTIYGIIGQYNSVAQIKNGWIVEHTAATTPSDPEATEPEATEPEATEPEATEPEATEPVVKPGQNETVTGSEIADGKYIISFGDLTLGALDETYNYGYPKAGSVAAYGNTDIVTITNVEGGFTIQDCYGRYLYLKDSYNSFNVSAEAPAEGHVWQIVANGDTYTIVNASNGKTLAYSTQYSSWGCYPELTDDHNSVITLTLVRDASADTGDRTISLVCAALLVSAMGTVALVSKKKEF